MLIAFADPVTSPPDFPGIEQIPNVPFIMLEAAEPPFVFISHSHADSDYADQMERLLADEGIRSWNFNSAVSPGDDILDQAKPALLTCTHIMVLIGPLTKSSLWVDMEMEIATSARESGPGAGLIGVILPDHEDFRRPYYEPSRVPIRLHDLVSRDVASVKKWTTAPAEVRAWLNYLGERRSQFQGKTRPSSSALRSIMQQDWTNEGDIARPQLFSLSSQHAPPP